MLEHNALAKVNDIDLGALVRTTGLDPSELRGALGLPEKIITVDEAVAQYGTLVAAATAWEAQHEYDPAHGNEGIEYLAVVKLFNEQLEKARSFAACTNVCNQLHPAMIAELPLSTHKRLLQKFLRHAQTLEELRQLSLTLRLRGTAGARVFVGGQWHIKDNRVQELYPPQWESKLDRMIADADSKCQNPTDRLNLALRLHSLAHDDLIEKEVATNYYLKALATANLQESLAMFKRFHHKTDLWAVLALRRIAKLQQK